MKKIEKKSKKQLLIEKNLACAIAVQRLLEVFRDNVVL